MKIAVIGAGVVGVATANALAERGHEVHVYERRSDIASDTSASTAGLVAPGHSYAWASPKAPVMLVKSLLGETTSIRVRPRADAELIRWGLRFLRECTPSRSRANTLAKLRLARYSQQLMDELAAREGLQYWQTHEGVLYLYHGDADLVAAERHSRLLQEHGRHQQVLNFDQVTALEPALGYGRTRFAGAIHDTSDGTGDPQLFATGLAEVCRRLGVTFHLGASVTGMDTDGSSVTRIITSDSEIRTDAVVLAAGSASPLLTRPWVSGSRCTRRRGTPSPPRSRIPTGHRTSVASTNDHWWPGRGSAAN